MRTNKNICWPGVTVKQYTVPVMAAFEILLQEYDFGFIMPFGNNL